MKINNKSQTGKKIRTYYSKGRFVTDDIVNSLIKK